MGLSGKGRTHLKWQERKDQGKGGGASNRGTPFLPASAGHLWSSWLRASDKPFRQQLEDGYWRSRCRKEGKTGGSFPGSSPWPVHVSKLVLSPSTTALTWREFSRENKPSLKSTTVVIFQGVTFHIPLHPNIQSCEWAQLLQKKSDALNDTILLRLTGKFRLSWELVKSRAT